MQRSCIAKVPEAVRSYTLLTTEILCPWIPSYVQVNVLLAKRTPDT